MLIHGIPIAKEIEERICKAIKGLHHRPPGLAFIRVGDHAASYSYIRMKQKKCAEVGIRSIDREFPASVSEKALIETIHQLNADPAVDGILVQLPLPESLNAMLILNEIDPQKDVDGFHPINMGKLLLGERDGFVPCTPLGIHIMLTHSQIPLLGKHVVIIGRSNIVGKPLAALLMQKAPHCNATVTIAHRLTADLPQICRQADILIAAMGQPRFVTADMVKEGAVVIDVGINRMAPKSLVGDVDFEAVAPKASAITPVPGGVGPMTIAMLLSNTLLSYQRRMQISI